MAASEMCPLCPAGTLSRVLVIALIASTRTLSTCHGFDNSLVNTLIKEKINSGGRGHGQQDSSVLGALYLEKECSNDLSECQKPGALADMKNPRCFSFCIAVETGCRSCCTDRKCYSPPVDDASLGFCRPCPHNEDGEECALTL
jgi:hypothetical protein